MQTEAFKQVLDSIGALPQKTVMFEDSLCWLANQPKINPYMYLGGLNEEHSRVQGPCSMLKLAKPKQEVLVRYDRQASMQLFCSTMM